MSSHSQLLIGTLIRRNAEVVPNRTAAWMAGKSLSFAQIDRLSNQFAWMLSEAGIGHGDRVVCWADTALEVLPLFVATAKLGAVFAPLNARLSSDEAMPIAKLARPALFVSDRAHAQTSASLVASLQQQCSHTLLSALLQSGDDADDTEYPDFDVLLDSARCQANDVNYHEPRLQELDQQVIFFTSGSTGAPKGVILSHRANYLRSYQGVFIDEPERSVCMFPLFHMAAFTLTLAAWQTRGEIAFVEPPTAEGLLTAVQARKATRLYCIPAVWNRILDTKPEDWDTSSLRTLDTGTSATPMELLLALKTRFPKASLRVYYGSTEVGAGTALLDADVLRKPGSVGQASPGVELKLSDAGEICLRSDFVTDGYFDAPDTTAATIRDGWFHTGDLGVLDDDAYLSIIGRMKEIIRTGGESVAPVEVEAALVGCPGVNDVAVVGIPDPQWGELVCAVVVAASANRPSLDQLQKHCGDSLASFKKPRKVVYVDDFPRTPSTGQTQRTLLVEQILAGKY